MIKFHSLKAGAGAPARRRYRALTLACALAGLALPALPAARAHADMPSVQPGSYAFPSTTEVGETSASEEFTIWNQGEGELDITRLELVRQSPDRDFEISSNRCLSEKEYKLAEGENCRVDVTFTPSNTSGQGAWLLVVGQAGQAEARIAGQARGVELEWNPGQRIFNTVPVGDNTRGKVTIKASGTISETGLKPMELIGPGKSEFRLVDNTCEGLTELVRERRCGPVVVFEPTAPGLAEAKLFVAGDRNSTTLEISGRGESPTADLTPNGGLDFGAVDLGSQSRSEQFTLTNDATVAPLSLEGPPAIAGAGAFQVTADDCPATLAAKTSCQIGVAFRPTNTGFTEGALVVKSNSSDGELRGPLRGTGSGGSVLSPTPSVNPSPTPRKTEPQTTTPPDGTTAIYDGTFLYLRVKCPKGFAPRCGGKAFAFSEQKGKARAGRSGKVVTKTMTRKVNASQKAGKWMVVRMRVLGRYKSTIMQMAKRSGGKRVLHVAQQISARKFKQGKRQTLKQTYRVLYVK